jgi:hypothetical protein
MTTSAPRKPMHDHLFLALAQVNTREHVTQLRAARAGVTTLSEYHAWKAAR